MEAEKMLLTRYASFGYLSGEEFYLDMNHAETFISDCSTLGLAIIGVEFFRIKANRITPLNPINSIDSSSVFNQKMNWKAVVQECNQFASQVIAKIRKKDATVVYCNFILISEKERD